MIDRACCLRSITAPVGVAAASTENAFAWQRHFLFKCRVHFAFIEDVSSGVNKFYFRHSFLSSRFLFLVLGFGFIVAKLSGAMACGFRFALLWLLLVGILVSSCAARESYVVYMGRHAGGVEPHRIFAAHQGLLALTLGSDEAAHKSLLYSYSHCINGFAALLDPEHVSAISAMPGVVSVFPNRAHSLHTTRSWEFLGLELISGETPDSSLWAKANYGEDVIIGVLDTGIWPESESFNDTGFGPIPERWNGTCMSGTNFTSADCNRKLIGARYFVKGFEAVNGPLNETAIGDFLSPRDKEGHGTHTSSTAGGSFVVGANIFGFANGTAKGGAPKSRVATYKVCWSTGCYDADILAAFDAGIQDGVDVFSLSLGSGPPLSDYFADSIAIGSFHAVAEGKIVACSAGNDGPSPATVSNVAPWILTVAASSIDRRFPSAAVLGDRSKYIGSSLSEYHLDKKVYPLVTGSDVMIEGANVTAGQLCFPGSLNAKKTKGKIVACLRGVNPRVEKGAVVKQAGGKGMILLNLPSDADEIISDPHVLPATQVVASDAASILDYINRTGSSALAFVGYPHTLLDAKPAPQMASFSSQGPNILTPDILKPDITAPGLNILAAWTGASPPTATAADDRRVTFNVMSGTSMACPHMSGVVALLRALHPTWSVGAIKSAIMTTASHYGNDQEPIVNGSLSPANPFNYGAGHVNPNAAANPGLLYDLSSQDYFLFLCALHYNSSALMRITGSNSTCPSNVPGVVDLNYPSISLSHLSGEVSIVRTVTYVGGDRSYEVGVRPPKGVEVEITPSKLVFSSLGEKQNFSVKLRVIQGSRGKYVFGAFTWTDGKYRVRSPIAVNATEPKH